MTRVEEHPVTIVRRKEAREGPVTVKLNNDPQRRDSSGF